MPYAIVEDIAASWERYVAAAEAIVDPAPSGLILYAAGATDEGIRIIGVWEHADAWERFRAERLSPALAALPGPAPPLAAIRSLHAEHVVVGDAVPSVTASAAGALPSRHVTRSQGG